MSQVGLACPGALFPLAELSEDVIFMFPTSAK